MPDFLALMTIIFWPVIPLFWIPVHGFSKILKRLGLITYLLPLVTWLPLAYLIYSIKNFLLQFKIELPFILSISGTPLLVLGILLHIWTGKLLGLWGLIGLPEVYTRIKGKLVTEGPFSVVRHPTYFAHTLIFSGVFLITGIVSIGIITIIDIFLIHIFIIPLEEKELLNRFGEEYRLYRKRVSRYFPCIHY
jgi:protein-S-isoprenylcysteine O-methyltransferase Ste14